MSESEPNVIMDEDSSLHREKEMKAKILILDIENAPNLGYFWDTWSKGPWNAIKILEEWYILCVGYKWLHQKAQIVSLDDFKGYAKDRRNEYALLEVVWHLLDEADVVVGWNSKAFDIKKINAKFLQYGFSPPSPYKQVDVMCEKKKLARSNSNKLDDTSAEWGTGRKLPHEGFPLWESCMMGVEKAWKKMRRYCLRDVCVTERNYLKLRPWMATHPNLNVYSGQTMACPICEKTGTLIKRGFAPAGMRRRQIYHCSLSRGGCGRYNTGPLLPQDPNKKILVK